MKVEWGEELPAYVVRVIFEGNFNFSQEIETHIAEAMGMGYELKSTIPISWRGGATGEVQLIFTKVL